MLVVLLALFAGSLGFAQWLVVRVNRTAGHENQPTLIVRPPGRD